MAHKENFVGPDGEAWPSVTEVLTQTAKIGFYYWYGRDGIAACERAKKTGAEFGTKVHDLIDGGKFPPKLTSRALILAKAATDWMEQTKCVTIEQEKHLLHPGLRYHGTPDRIVRFQGANSKWILDWKTVKTLDKTLNEQQRIAYGEQLAAYAAAYNFRENVSFGDPTAINSGAIIRLARNTSDKLLDTLTFPDLEPYFEHFKHGLARTWFFWDRGIKFKAEEWEL